MLTSTGIGSGLDIESLVTQLVAAERTPTETRIQRQELTLASQLSSLGIFQGSLASLRDSISSLNDSSLFNSKSLLSNDLAAVSGSVEQDAAVGSYDIEVNQLAQAHTLASEVFSAADEVVGEGSLTIRFGTTDYVSPDPGPESYNSFVENTDIDSLVLELDSSNNQLDQIRDSINEADAGVSASIINDGDGYRLVLTSASTGEEYSMEMVVSDTGDSNDTDASGLSRLAFSAAATNMEQTRTGLDAEVLLNGLSVSSSTNSLDEAIEGLTISLNQTTEDPVTLTISEDHSTLTQRVATFATSYNNYLNTVDQVAGYDADLSQGGVLQGDFTVRSITNQLRSMMSTPAPGATGEYQYLSQIGINTLDSGQLQFDTAAFLEAMEADADSVAALFSDRVETTDAEIQTFNTNSANAVNGSWPVTISQMPTQAEYLGSSLTFPVVIDSDNDEFSIEVDGTSSGVIQLTSGSYASGDDLVSMMLTALGADTSLSEADKVPDLVYNSTDNRLEFRSKDWGSATSIEILTVDLNTSTILGFSVGEGTDGLDVEGQIGTWDATGSGRILSAPVDTDIEGISLEVTGGFVGDRGDVSFSQGMSSLIEQMADRYLLDEGPLVQRTESINDRLDDLQEQRETLDSRMAAVEARYRDQFNTLDSLLAQLQSTSTYLSQQLENLPGPRTSSD